MPSCSERTGRVLDGRLVLGGQLWAALAACDGSGAASAGPDAGSCCRNCLPGYSGTSCARCPGMLEWYAVLSFEEYGCEGLSGQALCDCLLLPPYAATGSTCNVVAGVAIFTPPPATCVHLLGGSGLHDACEYDPDRDEPRLSRWQEGGPGR